MCRLTTGDNSASARATVSRVWTCGLILTTAVVSVRADEPKLDPKLGAPVSGSLTPPNAIKPVEVATDPASILRARIEQQLGGAGRTSGWYVIHLAERRWIRPTASPAEANLKKCSVVEDITVLVVSHEAAADRLLEFLTQPEESEDPACARIRRSWQLHRRFDMDKKELAERLSADLQSKLAPVAAKN